MPVSEQTFDEIWRQMLNAARLSRCYDRLSRLYGLARFAIRFVLALSAVGFLAAVSEVLPEEHRGWVAIVLLVIIAFDLITDFAKKRIQLGYIATSYAGIETEWRNLWSEAIAGRIGEEEADARVRQFLQTHRALDEKADGVGVTTWRRLNEYYAREVAEIYGRQYVPDWVPPRRVGLLRRILPRPRVTHA